MPNKIITKKKMLTFIPILLLNTDECKKTYSNYFLERRKRNSQHILLPLIRK